MGNMEFTWRMVGTLVWPVVAIVALIAYRKWITQNLQSLRLKVGTLVEGEVKTLNDKVEIIGRDVEMTLSEVPRPSTDGEIPESLVDLMPVVNRSRSEGIHAAFGQVRKALQHVYPQLRRVPPARLPDAMQGLVDKGLMEADVAQSVKHLYELLEMPEWNQDLVGDTRGYAFLMLAEGAIHGILRSAQARRADADGAQLQTIGEPISPVWRGTYNDSNPIELRIRQWQGLQFSGDMTYPDSDEGRDADTVTNVRGEISKKIEGGGFDVTWKELGYIRQGRRSVDFDGDYSATVTEDVMYGDWYRKGQLIAGFKMTAIDLP